VGGGNRGNRGGGGATRTPELPNWEGGRCSLVRVVQTWDLKWQGKEMETVGGGGVLCEMQTLRKKYRKGNSFNIINEKKKTVFISSA